MSQSPKVRSFAIAERTAELGELLRSSTGADRHLASTPPEAVIEALEETLAAIQHAELSDPSSTAHDLLVGLLDAGRRPAFLQKIHGTPLAVRWLQAVLRAIDAGNVTLRDVFLLRSAQDPDRPQVIIPRGRATREITRRELGERVRRLGAALLRYPLAEEARVGVAILAPNRLETMLVDLACLTHGIVNTPVPGDSTPEQVRIILEQARPAVLVVSDMDRLQGLRSGGSVASVRAIILMDPPDDMHLGEGVRLLAEVEAAADAGGGAGRAPAHAAAIPRGARDLATIMFTSGTTGRPKGIRFTHRNILYKRFCRAVALPEIGEEDVFLCYLPLFHTFGRWLEMSGSLFWGARYAFMESPSLEATLSNLRSVRPSIFISIPKRWIQLQDQIVKQADPTSEDPLTIDAGRLRRATGEVTGGRLRWGLSAAGYLDPDVFLFFQRNGIELMSGFGMTEATGGITMTPPGRYRRGTVGQALPGVEIRRAEDGELLVRGPYMMAGYDDAGEPLPDYEHDWFPTGDLVECDPEGYVTIVDRKKDIYKNVKGQTIAPQKIENLFDEFDEIKRAFLVGDGREYNTLLIYPDYDASNGKLARMQGAELREYLSSYVVSVNRFLAPYERVVDFEVLPRYFREEGGELTPKGTFVRKVVERNFSELIEGMYARTSVSVQVQGIDVRLPSWFLREKGLTSDAIIAEPGGIRLRHTGDRLSIERFPGGPGRFRVGSFDYVFETEERWGGGSSVVDLDILLRVARTWVGNAELARFVGETVTRRPRPVETAHVRVSVAGFRRPVLLLDETRERFRLAMARRERGPEGLHAVASYLLAAPLDEAQQAMDAFERILEDSASEEGTLARGILPLLRMHAAGWIRRRALALLLQREVDESAGRTLKSFLEEDPSVWDDEVRQSFLVTEPPAPAIRAIIALARGHGVTGGASERMNDRARVGSLLSFLAELGGRYPRWYAQARHVLALRAGPEEDEGLAAAAEAQARRLDQAFRTWIAASGQAETPSAGGPVDWESIIGFDDRLEPDVRMRLKQALAETTLLRESVFLLGEHALIGPGDLLESGGLWIGYLGAGHGKTVARVTVCTRSGRFYEFVVKLLRPIAPQEAAEEVRWMIRLGAIDRTVPLVPEFGGYWPDIGIWSEEYIAHETVQAVLRSWTRAGDPERIARLRSLWPHFAWCALTTFVEFWQRTGRRVVLAEPLPFNVVVAPEDYQDASRLVSVSARTPFRTLAELMRAAYVEFVERSEEEYPVLRGLVDRRLVFLALLEAVGEDAGIPLLWRALAEMREDPSLSSGQDGKAWQGALAHTIEEVERAGYVPRRLVMAVRRYNAWKELNAGASLQAQAIMLQDLYETYALYDLEAPQPSVRVRFFRMTVFADCRELIASELDGLIRVYRDMPLTLETLLRQMTVLHQKVKLTDEEAYFLARMTYAHLSPLRRAKLELHVEAGETKADLVEEVRDEDGMLFRIRAAMSPKEVMRLHRHFEQAGLSVVFRPDHRFLVSVDENESVAGGIFYRAVDTRTIHMEKIVVAPRHRGRGVGKRLMESFLQRMRDAGRTAVTTGFFRPQYFRRFGFRLEPGVAGLVKDLTEGTSAGRERSSPEA